MFTSYFYNKFMYTHGQLVSALISAYSIYIFIIYILHLMIYILLLTIYITHIHFEYYRKGRSNKRRRNEKL